MTNPGCDEQELDRLLRSIDINCDRVIYIGDGRGDFCPVRVLVEKSCQHGFCAQHEFCLTSESSQRGA